MKLGLVGMGRMGSGIAARLRNAGHEVVAYDADAARSETVSLDELVGALTPPRIVWLMLPSGEATEGAVEQLATLLDRGDLLIDGGNSYYGDSQRRAAALTLKGIDLLDAGTSGGVWGEANGFCLMVGGPTSAFDAAEPLFQALAAPGGYAHVGPAGAGHYAKMAHNGIEYGLMQAYAEGFSLLEASDFDYDLAGLGELWGQRSVIRSWLLELAAKALAEDPKLETLQGYVDDSGEGRWVVQEAVERAVPLPTITLSLYRRFASREENAFANRFVAALRREFGGHAVRQP